MRFRMWMVLGAAAILAFAANARSEESAEAEEAGEAVEPFSIEETLPTEPGHWALRITSDASFRGESDVSDHVFQQQAQAFIGLTEGLSAEIHLPFVSRHVADESWSGIGAFGGGLKARLAGGRVPVVARAEFQLPVQDEMLGESSSEVEFALASLARAGRWTVQGGPGYSALTDGSERAVFIGVSIALETSEAWHLLLEADAARRIDPWETSVLLGPGVRYSFAPGWSVAAGAQADLVGEESPWRLLGQIQRGF